MCLRFCRRVIGKPERVAFLFFGTHQDIFRFNILTGDTFALAPTALDNYQMSLRTPPARSPEIHDSNNVSASQRRDRPRFADTR
jgi:hypothetical protein